MDTGSHSKSSVAGRVAVPIAAGDTLETPRLGHPSTNIGGGSTPTDGSALSRLAQVTLPEVATFSEFEPWALRHLAKKATIVQVAQGALLFRAMDKAMSFFVVVSGEFEAVVDDELTIRFGRNMTIGLWGLLYRRTRALTVQATTASTVLEIPVGSLQDVIESSKPAHARIVRHFRTHALNTFMASCPALSSCDEDMSNDIRQRLVRRSCTVGEALVSPGEVTNGLYLVVFGALEVAGGGERKRTIQPGEYLTVHSGLDGQPARVTVTALEPSSLLYLSHNDLAELHRIRVEHSSWFRRLAAHSELVDRSLYVAPVLGMGV